MSKIEWTERTWNPTTGCTKVSPGCDNCFAERVSARLAGRVGYPADEPFRLTLHPNRLDIPLRVKRPTTWFVDSMSDLFHPDVPSGYIAQVWDVMRRTPHHTYQVLTKRPGRAKLLLAERYATPEEVDAGCELGVWPGLNEDPVLPNVWVGTSVESDRYMYRVRWLRDTPAAVRFLSIEPLLGRCPSLDLTGIHWVIVGGESGPRARPMHPDWVRDIRDRCVREGVPFFFKQWGEFDIAGRRVGKKAAGRLLDGVEWSQYP